MTKKVSPDRGWGDWWRVESPERGGKRREASRVWSRRWMPAAAQPEAPHRDWKPHTHTLSHQPLASLDHSGLISEKTQTEESWRPGWTPFNHPSIRLLSWCLFIVSTWIIRSPITITFTCLSSKRSSQPGESSQREKKNLIRESLTHQQFELVSQRMKDNSF